MDNLSDKGDTGHASFYTTIRQLVGKDSNTAMKLVRQLEAGIGDNHYYNARVHCLKFTVLTNYRGFLFTDEIKQHCTLAIQEAYESEDDYVIFFANQRVGGIMYSCQQLELAAIYSLKAEEVNEKLEKKTSQQTTIWLQLGDILFHAREYRKSIYYTLKSLGVDNKLIKPGYRTLQLNMIAQAYYKLKAPDSALIFLDKSNRMAATIEDSSLRNTWLAINAGLDGELLLANNALNSAKEKLQYSYSVNKELEKNTAAYSLQWLAQINLREKNYPTALSQVREALGMLEEPDRFSILRLNYLQTAYSTAADVFRSLKNVDSFFHYTKRYTTLHDSLERVAFSSSLTILKEKLDNEKSIQLIKILQKEKKAEVQWRNFMIAFIILAAIIAMLYINKLRVNFLHKEQLGRQERAAAEAMAKEQLQHFRQNLVEKTRLVEDLQTEIASRSNNAERQDLFNAIASLTILTEEEWTAFRGLYEKMYPGFFFNLQKKVTDITAAEMRMAALTQLKLSTNQIASILGISANSVYKTKQRLRQRLGLESDMSIEDAIAQIA